jgi:hypothetical protein
VNRDGRADDRGTEFGVFVSGGLFHTSPTLRPLRTLR